MSDMRKQNGRVFTLGITIGVMLLLSVSCVHQSPFIDEHYYSALGESGEVVLTLDTKKSAQVFDLSDSPLQPFLAFLDRIDRISLSLYQEEGKEGFSYYGGMEGNIPSFLTNTMFLHDDSFTKVEEGEVRYYRNESLGIDVYSPKSGLLLFASDAYLKAYTQTYTDRQTKIRQSLADRMGNAIFGFYGEGSQNLIDIGIEIPEAVLAKTVSMTVVFDTDEKEDITLGAILEMESDSLAKSLSILLKSQYISEKRRNHEPLGELEGLFELEGTYVYINRMYLSDEQREQIMSLFSQVISTHNGGTSDAVL